MPLEARVELRPSAKAPDDREFIRELMDCHFDPKWGSPYWLNRRAELKFDPRRDVRFAEDMNCFGPFPEEDLRQPNATRFIPLRYRDALRFMVPSETGGTTGRPKRVFFSEEEFAEGFITPFLEVCQKAGWPRGARWAYLGPSGPHIIGKVVEPICRRLNSPPPLSIDFDPRWALRLSEGSAARARYLDHLVDQAVNLLESETLEVLFGTPPILVRLAERLPEEKRLAIRAVHYGGTALTPETYSGFRRHHYPNAIHLSGYGNSLVGVAFEAETCEEGALSYYPARPRHRIRIVSSESAQSPVGDLEDVPLGERGRVVVSRLDKTFFIPNLVERDSGTAIGPTPASLALGWTGLGVRNPQPLPEATRVRGGLY